MRRVFAVAVATFFAVCFSAPVLADDPTDLGTLAATLLPDDPSGASADWLGLLTSGGGAKLPPNIGDIEVKGTRQNNKGQISINLGVDKNASQPEPCPDKTAGNPIVFATGNKIEPETDFVSGGIEMPLYLERTYNNYWNGIGIFGGKWLSNFDFKLSFETASTTSNCYPEPGNLNACSPIPVQPVVLWAHRPDGRRIKLNWDATASAWLEEKASPIAKIVKNADGSYTLTSEDNTTERYSNIGYVLERKSEAGIGWTFSYTNNYLNRVTHTSGRYVQFTWTGSRLTRVTDPAGNQFNYTYLADRFGTNVHLLASTVLPGTSPTTIAYHYEDGRFLGALTGKSYNSVRYSTFAYDSSQRAISSEHAGVVNKYTFSYTGSADAITSAVVTNPLGKQTTFAFTNGQITSVAGAGSPYCLATYSERTYDANGYEDIVFDDNGNVTDFDYNAKGQLRQKVEGQGTAVARTTQYT